MEKIDRLLDDREVAEIIGRARSSLQKDRLVGGGIPFVRIGRRVFFVRHALIQWVSDEMTLPR